MVVSIIIFDSNYPASALGLFYSVPRTRGPIYEVLGIDDSNLNSPMLH